MAADTTILSGDVGVWWLSNGRTKMLTWEGTTGTYTMNQLYSAMQTLQDESDTIDDGTCFFADTPTEYTTGKIDAGDNDPWYVSLDLMEHITGGSLRTSGWTHATASNTGIVIVPMQGVGTITTTDYGYTLSGGTDGSGTLLEIIDDGTDVYFVIRPDDDTAGSEFTGDGQTLTSSRGAFTALQHATEDQNTGEMIWANIYSIGTISNDAHLYVYQGTWNSDTPTDPATDESNRVYSANSTSVDYWGNGHIDICVPIQRWWRLASEGAWDASDGAYLRVFARKGGDLYASFEVANSTTSGGRNPVPLQTSGDLNQGTGTKTVTTGAWTNTPVDGEVITQATSLARGIIDLANSVVDTSISYFPIATAADGGALTAFDNTNTISGATWSAASSGTPQDAGPALASWFTNTAFPDLLYGDTNVQATTKGQDIDNDGTDENYGIVVDCNSNTLAEVYEWLKYICQYTQGDTHTVEQALTDDLTQANVYGEEFVGAEAYFIYGTLNGTINEGASVTQDTTGATGVILSIDTNTNVVLLRNVRGSFNGTNQVNNDLTPGVNNFTGLTAGGSFAASTSSPFGTFAGGTFFGARGVLLDNWLAANENQFILTDIEGTTRERPTSITIEVTNLWGNAVTETDADLVAVYKLTAAGGDIDKSILTCDGGEVEGGTTLATSAIPDWVPAAGRLVLVDVDVNNSEFVIGYSSWDSATDTFTFDSTAAFAALTTGTNDNTLVSTTDELDGLDRGDIIVNETLNGHAYVTSVDAASNTVTLDRDITGQATTDTIKANVLPNITVAATDEVYPLIMHAYPTSSTSQVSVIYPGAPIYFRVKVRNTRETDLVNGPIKPYSSDGSTSGTDQSIPTVRTIDTIIT